MVIKQFTAGAVISIAFALICGCASGVTGGKPQLELSNKSGTIRAFATNEPRVIECITNALGDFRYRGMQLCEASEASSLLPNSSLENGFVLRTIHEPIARVPLDKNGNQWVPYIAYFHISVVPVSNDLTRVTVRTILSEVIDGKEPFNFHGGTANHYRKVPAVREEEENVLDAIGARLTRANNK
jgi:hypothetical protein